MSFRKHTIILALGAAISTSVGATTVTYTISGTASGYLGHYSFSNEAFTIRVRQYGDNYHLPTSSFLADSVSFEFERWDKNTKWYLGAEQSFIKHLENSPYIEFGTGGNSDGVTMITLQDSDLINNDWKTYIYDTNVDSVTLNYSSFDTRNGPGITLTSFSDVSVSASVPEPGSLALAGLGLAGVATTIRRRKK